ncbi:MAG: polynucleotide adenylyltransferase, partial [Lachnospiraceae bacterium]|nr:polynucleotide adenylyltransferase [Lachnospiraceae bacterium]
EKVTKLVLYHDYGIAGDVGIKSFRRFLAKLGIDNFDDFIIIRNADRLGQSDYNQDKKKENIAKLKNMYDKVISENQCLTIRDLKIDGKDLIELGMKPGRELGIVLKSLLEQVLDEPSLNEKNKLLQLAKNMIKEQKNF